MVAIVLTTLVVLLAYSAAQVSYDAHARLSADLRALQQGRALRELLQDALRSARAPQRPGDPLFTLHAGRLSFVTRITTGCSRLGRPRTGGGSSSPRRRSAARPPLW